MEQAALIAKYWDGKLPVVIADIVQNVINEKHSQLRTLAEAVLTAHSSHYPNAYHVGCPACQLAREIMEVGND
jgi:hypothetical protein